MKKLHTEQDLKTTCQFPARRSASIFVVRDACLKQFSFKAVVALGKHTGSTESSLFHNVFLLLKSYLCRVHL